MIGNLLQLGLAVFGLAAFAMAQTHNARLRKWAPVVGLFGQPLWFWFALRTPGAWGLVVLAIAFTLVYAFGISVHWKRRAAA